MGLHIFMHPCNVEKYEISFCYQKINSIIVTGFRFLASYSQFQAA